MNKQTRMCKVSDLQPELRSRIQQLISANENILYCFESKYELGGVDKAIALFNFSTNALKPSFSAQVITDYQFVHVSTGELLKITSDAILLTDILSVQEKSYLDIYTVAVRGHGKTEINCSFATQQDTHKFAEILRDVIAKVKNSSMPASNDSHTDSESRLRKLSQLYKDGLITETEYQQKRKEIIDEL